jgi:hypothetical protein
MVAVAPLPNGSVFVNAGECREGKDAIANRSVRQLNEVNADGRVNRKTTLA